MTATDNRAPVQRLEALICQIDQLPDLAARGPLQETVQALLDLHAGAMARVLELAGVTEAGATLIDALAHDDLVGSLLVLYGLHPHDLPARAAAAVESIRPFVHKHGGTVELLGIEQGVVHLHVERSGAGCASTAKTIRRTVEEAVYDKAPDAAGVIIEGLPDPDAPAESFVPLGALALRDRAANGVQA